MLLAVSALSGLPALAQDGAPVTTGQPADVGGSTEGRAIPGRVEIVRNLVDNGQVEREEVIHVAFPPEAPAVNYTLTNRHATLSSAVLQNPRYTREALPPHGGAPEDKVRGGPIDLVSTWSTRWLPFHTVFGELDYPAEVTLVIRRGDKGRIIDGQLAAPEGRDALAVDRPVRVGDRVVVTAPEAFARTYEVQTVGAGGALQVAPPFPSESAEGLTYTVTRVGGPRALFEADPIFTRVSEDAGLPAVYVWPDPTQDTSPVWIERRIDAGNNPYELRLTVTVHNTGPQILRVQPGVRVSAWQHPESGQPSLFGGPTNLLRAVCQTVDGRESKAFSDLLEEAHELHQRTGQAQFLKAFPVGTSWVAADTNYFIQAVAPLLETPGGQCQLGLRDFAPHMPGAWVMWSTWLTSGIVQLQGRGDGCLPDWMPDALLAESRAGRCGDYLRTLGLPPTETNPGRIKAAWDKHVKTDVSGADAARAALEARKQVTWRFALFNGPKETDHLASTHPSLPGSVDFGWMSFVGSPLHDVLVWLYEALGSWPIAIILLTIGLKLLTWPLTSKTYTSMQKMQAIKPKLDALKEKYGSDRQRFAQEQMALMRAEGVNPFAGCLPMLLQFPIWIGLYGAILGSVELYNEPLGFWINDLSSPDPYFVLPILEGLLMFGQTTLTPSAASMQGAQAKIMKFGMPVMFTLFMLFLPAGLVLYIIINTALTIVQNLLIKRRMKTA